MAELFACRKSWGIFSIKGGESEGTASVATPAGGREFSPVYGHTTRKNAKLNGRRYQIHKTTTPWDLRSLGYCINYVLEHSLNLYLKFSQPTVLIVVSYFKNTWVRKHALRFSRKRPRRNEKYQQNSGQLKDKRPVRGTCRKTRFKQVHYKGLSLLKMNA